MSMEKNMATKQDKDKKKTVKADKKPQKNTEKKKSKPKKTDGKPKKMGTLTYLKTKYLGGFLLSKMAKNGAKELSQNAEKVNNLNVFPVPDGDTGDNMRMTIEAGIAAIENMESDNLSDIMVALSHGMLLGARGNSGVITSQFFAGIAKGLEGTKRADPATFGLALKEGVKQAYASVVTPTEGTILTVAREAVDYAVDRINEKSTIRSLFADLTSEMYAAVDRTPEALKVLKDAGVVDSGGAGLFFIIDGFNRVLNGEELPDSDNNITSQTPASKTEFAFNENSEMTYAYCTEALLQLQTSKCDTGAFDVEKFKEFLIGVGDSVVAFKTGSIVKLHVHTFTPEVVLGHCRKFGEFLTVKIENMSVQHTELKSNDKIDEPSEASQENATRVPTERKKYAIVSVCNGTGVEALFTDFGVDVIIQGGQTQNPSTNDFIEAFDKINAECIYVLPNNSNIMLAAQQAAELYTEAKVCVIPSKSLGAGYVALTALDFSSLEPEDVMHEAEEIMRRVSTGYISPSVRDADMNGIHICKGDTIGIIDKEIVVSDPDRSAAAHKLATLLLGMPDKFMLTVFFGADATDADRTTLKEYLAAQHPDAEVYYIDGEQQIYPFIFAAE